MPNGGVKKETFSRLDYDEKLDVLFDQQSEIIETVKYGFPCQSRGGSCEERFKRIERWQTRLTGVFFFGVIILIPGIEIAIRIFA